MLKTRFFILFFFALSSLQLYAQKEPEKKQPRILILLDESSSMLDNWENSTPRYKAAGKIILNLMDSIYRVNNQVEFALRVFGHQYTAQENNCYDTKREVMFSKNNYTQMQLRLADIKPLGVTPIAYALQQAAENDLLEDYKYAYSIVLITDGGESCGGDICEVVKTLLNKKIYFKPYIVSLVDYAPLKTEYTCLGEYLQVVHEHDIPTVVDSIVTAFRPALILNTAQYHQYLRTKVIPPDALQITNEQVNVPPTTANPIKTIEVPVVKTPESTTGINTQNTPEIKQPDKTPTKVTPVTVPPTAKATELPKEQINKITSVSATSFIFPVVFTTKVIGKKRPPEILQPRISDPDATIIRTKGSTIKTDVTPKEAPFTIKTEDADKTSVQIYFTDGHGKFYNTTPQITLDDPKTGKELKRFFRTLDASNNPDPQQLPAGSYNLSVVNGKTKAHNITIQPNKNNKISIVVHNSTLSFYYIGNDNRPVTEFDALVTHREYGGQQIKQKCSQQLEYEPGNYHISINTLPALEKNGDLEMDVEIRVGIPEPGWIQFTNTNKIGKVSLYTVLGDKYLRFYSMDVSGFPESQKLRLLPGPYKVHFLKYPGTPSMDETVLDFRVESNATTELELKLK